MVERSWRCRAVLAIAGLVAVSVGVVSPVAADDGMVATETGEALEAAGSLVADAAPLAETGDGFVAVAAGSEVELPADPAESLVLDGAGGEVGVDLPVVAGLGDGVVDESGAVVYESDVSPVSLAAQATGDGGLQVLVVIDGPDAPTEYRFDMTVPEGATLVPAEAGGIDILTADGMVLAAVAPAWAVDADGGSVASSYRIEGTSVVQRVEHHGATYPVVADPRVSFGWGAYVYMTGLEIKALQAGILAAGGVVAIVSCGATFLDRLPIVGLAASLIKLLCGFFGIGTVTPILRAVGKVVNNRFFNSNGCFEYKVPGNGEWKAVHSGNC